MDWIDAPAALQRERIAAEQQLLSQRDQHTRAALMRVAAEQRQAASEVEDAAERFAGAAAEVELGDASESALVAAETALDEAERRHRRTAAAARGLGVRMPLGAP